MFDNILWHVQKKKKNYLSFRPKKCEKKTNNTTKYCISKWKFHISSKTYKEKNRKRENSILFMFGRIYFVTLCFGRC